MHQIGPRIEVAVAYGLREYLQILRDYVAMDLAQGGQHIDTARPWNWPIVQDLTFRLLVPVIFLWKKSRVGDCVFVFDDSGLARTSKEGAASRAWAQVRNVHRLSTAYLIELKEGGAMPVPLRCFTDTQRAAFDALLESVGADTAESA